VSVRGIRWYGGAVVALIAAAAALGFFARSFFSSFTPLYVSIACSVAAAGCAVVAIVRSRRPDDTV
jgi:threonine/homoserine efflux transporter RhtA